MSRFMHRAMRHSFTIQPSFSSFHPILARPHKRRRVFTNMKDYLNLWPQELLKLNSLTLKSKVSVMGERNQHLGPRWEFAKIQISVEPAPRFEVVDTTANSAEARRAGYLDWAIFGLLDVLLVAESAPLKNIKVIVERIEAHPVDSSQMAFRQAGRDAGRKVVEYLQKVD